MREIKFRAWDGKDMYEVDQIDLDGDKPKAYRFAGELYNPDAILMQYTGLKDKNGVEIYEGDIVKILDISGSGQTREFIREVKWFVRGYASYLETYGIEVIGNIYENKELLK